MNYTNASTHPARRLSRTRKIWTGCSPDGMRKRKNMTLRLALRGAPAKKARRHPGHAGGWRRSWERSRRRSPGNTKFESDPTLQDPRCVFQVLKRHFARYTPEMVERYCGVPQEVFPKVAGDVHLGIGAGEDCRDLLCGGLDATFERACRSFAQRRFCNCCWEILGGPAAEFWHCADTLRFRAQPIFPRSTTFCPGTCPCRFLRPTRRTLEKYIKKHTTQDGLWSNFDAYIISLLKAWYGDAATKENDWGFDWLPRVTGDHSHFGYWLDMADGKMEGLFVMGQNPAVGAPNGRLQRKAHGKLKWLVVRDMVETETASFWKDSPEVERGELEPETIATEVFLFPAAGRRKKTGRFTNTQRLLQFREKAVDPPGDARSETWFMYHLGRRLKRKPKATRARANAGLNALTWDYPTEGRTSRADVEAVSEGNQWMDGCRTASYSHTFKDLKNDGSTACGAWIYCGRVSGRRAQSRQSARIRKICLGMAGDLRGRRIAASSTTARRRVPMESRGASTRNWSGGTRRRKNGRVWIRRLQERLAARYARQSRQGEGSTALGGAEPFTLHPDGVGWLFVPSGLKDGPLPTHYEPLESLIDNPLYEQQDESGGAKERTPR